MLEGGSQPTMTSAKISCSVCGEPIAPQMEAICNACGKPYHLNQRNDQPGIDCGQVWINEEYLALEFACDTCLHPQPAATNLDEVLDSSEAATEAGIPEEALIAAADSGRLRSRRTGKGIYLFERGDVLAFARERR